MAKHLHDNPKLNYKAVVLLRLLLDGSIIHYQGRYWLLSEDHRMACAAIDQETGEMAKPDENGNITIIYVLLDTLQGFIEWADSIPDDEIIILGMESVLNQPKERV